MATARRNATAMVVGDRKALPFAVRCKDCEEVREMAEQCRLTHHRDVSPLFLNGQ